MKLKLLLVLLGCSSVLSVAEAKPHHHHRGSDGVDLATSIVNLVGAALNLVNPRPVVVVPAPPPPPAPVVVVPAPPPPPRPVVVVPPPPPPRRPVVVVPAPPPPRPVVVPAHRNPPPARHHGGGRGRRR